MRGQLGDLGPAEHQPLAVVGWQLPERRWDLLRRDAPVSSAQNIHTESIATLRPGLNRSDGVCGHGGGPDLITTAVLFTCPFCCASVTHSKCAPIAVENGE